MEFRFDTDVEVRYQDIDALGHVNNAVYGTYLEQARVRYFDRVLGVPIEDRSMVLANLDIDFRQPVTIDDRQVTVACGVVELGDSSFRMQYRVAPSDDGVPAATAETTLVAWDGDGSRPLPDHWREQFEAFEPEL